METEGSQVHENPSYDPILSHFSAVHLFTFYTFKIHFNIISPSMLCYLFPSGFQNKNLYAFV